MLLYRVNRRPLPTLGSGEQPESVMDHILQVLHFGQPTYTGQGDHQREWILGNRNILRDLTAFTGQIGWQGNDEQQTSRYVPETMEWRDELGTAERGARAPFAFDGRTRVLGILKHTSFSEKTLARVFQTLLREGEEQREWPSTEWSVEPVLDERDFLEWLHSVESVTDLTMVAEMPNPDGLEEFGPIWVELEARRARYYKTTMAAASLDVGLQGLEQDERVRGNLVMGRQGFGYVQAWGLRNGRYIYFDQREKVTRESTDELGPSWETTAEVVLETTRRTAPGALRPRPHDGAKHRREA